MDTSSGFHVGDRVRRKRPTRMEALRGKRVDGKIVRLTFHTGDDQRAEVRWERSDRQKGSPGVTLVKLSALVRSPEGQ